MRKTILIIILVAIMAYPPHMAFSSGATFSRAHTFSDGETLTASNLNGEFDNIINNLDPSGIGGASDNTTDMRSTTDPYPAGSESLATSLLGEIQRLRYMIQQITGMAYWYQDSYDTIWIPAGAMVPYSATITSGVKGTTWDYWAYDGATQEFVGFTIAMPDTWDLSTLKAKFYWSSDTGSTAGDTVEWGIRCYAISNDDTMTIAGATQYVISDTLLANNGDDLQISGATGNITVYGSPAMGDMTTCFVDRNVGGTDNMTEDAWLFGVLLQYKKGSTSGAAW